MSPLRPLCRSFRPPSSLLQLHGPSSALRFSHCASSIALALPQSPRSHYPIPEKTASVWTTSRIITQIRSYSNATSPPSIAPSNPTAQHKAQQLAKNLSKRQTEPKPPSKLLIYHAGTGRITFLAMFKVTSLFIAAFFCFAVLPAYVSEGQFEIQPIGAALCGIIPLILVTYATSPFVTHIHIHIPSSIPSLKTFVTSLPPTTPLTLTTMSLIGKPRYSQLQASHLRPERSRLGLVNYVRDHVDVEEAASRKWYNLRPVQRFYVQEDAALKTARRSSERKGSKSPVEWWIWDVVREKIARKAASTTKA